MTVVINCSANGKPGNGEASSKQSTYLCLWGRQKKKKKKDKKKKRKKKRKDFVRLWMSLSALTVCSAGGWGGGGGSRGGGRQQYPNSIASTRHDVLGVNTLSKQNTHQQKKKNPVTVKQNI